MSKEQIRQIQLTYLYESGFVANYVRKLLFKQNSYLADDYIGEAFLAICEIPTDKITELYGEFPDKDVHFGLRNFVSVVIRNTVRSTSSAAYRKLLRHCTSEYVENDETWKIMARGKEDTPDGWNYGENAPIKGKRKSK